LDYGGSVFPSRQLGAKEGEDLIDVVLNLLPGDGSILIDIQELVTASEYDIPVIISILITLSWYG